VSSLPPADRPALHGSQWLQRATLIDGRSPAKRQWNLLMKCFALYITLIIPWCIGFTFDSLEEVCTGATPLDNCYPLHLSKLDTLVDACFWCALACLRDRRSGPPDFSRLAA